jgi:hypothetical protein
MAQSVEAALHAANALEQARIDQCGDWLAIFVDDDAVVPVLHAIDHFAQVLPEVDRAGFGNHGDLISMTMNIIVVCCSFTVKAFPSGGYLNGSGRSITRFSR